MGFRQYGLVLQAALAAVELRERTAEGGTWVGLRVLGLPTRQAGLRISALGLSV